MRRWDGRRPGEEGVLLPGLAEDVVVECGTSPQCHCHGDDGDDHGTEEVGAEVDGQTHPQGEEEHPPDDTPPHGEQKNDEACYKGVELQQGKERGGGGETNYYIDH